MTQKELKNKKHEYLIAQLEMLENEELEKMLFLENFIRYHFITTEEHKNFSTRYIQIEQPGEEFDWSKVKGRYYKHNMYRKSIYIKIFENGSIELSEETDDDVMKKFNLTLKESTNE